MAADQPTTANHKFLRYYPASCRLLVVMLMAAEGILLLSEQWLPKGWGVLLAVASVLSAIAFMVLFFAFAILFHWRFQFSVRSLLLLVLAAAIPSSWQATEMKRARAQSAAVESLKKLGCTIGYDYEWDSSGAWIKSATPPKPAWLRKVFGDDFFIDVYLVDLYDGNDSDLELLAGMKRLHTLSLSSLPVTDAGLQHLEGLNQLRELELGDTRITDIGLKHLDGLQKLRELNLNGTQVTDAGLKRLVGLKQLESIDLNRTQITDLGVAYFEELPRLIFLGLEGTKITDAGLERLGKLKQLQLLWLTFARFSGAGIEKLEKTLPNLQIGEAECLDESADSSSERR